MKREILRKKLTPLGYYLIHFWWKIYWIIDLSYYWRIVRRWTIEYLQGFIDWKFYD